MVKWVRHGVPRFIHTVCCGLSVRLVNFDVCEGKEIMVKKECIGNKMESGDRQEYSFDLAMSEGILFIRMSANGPT